MLTTDALHGADLDRAADELLTNAMRLALAGLAAQAHEALGLLVKPGPWKLPAHGTLVHQLQRLLPPVSLLAGEACAAIAGHPPMSAAQCEAWAADEAQRQLTALARVGRHQQKPAGEGWSAQALETLAERLWQPEGPRPHLGFAAFCIDAEFVLKARLAQRFGCATSAVEVPSADELESLGMSVDEVAALIEQLTASGRIRIAPEAESVDTLEIVRAIDRYRRATGFGGGYLDAVFGSSWLLLAEAGRDEAALDVAEAWWSQDERALVRLVDLAAVPSVRRLVRAGRLGSLTALAGVDADAARAWLAALAVRRTAVSAWAAAPDEAQVPPVPTAKALKACLKGTPLHALTWLKVAVPDSIDHAWVASVPAADRRALWQQAHALVGKTGRWPLVTTLWSGAGPVDKDRLSHELFMRSPYAQGASRDDLSPRSFIETSRAIDPAEFRARLAAREEPLDDAAQCDLWRSELARAGATSRDFDAAWDACGGDRLRFERWLADQEQQHGVADPDPDRGRQPAFDPDNAWLVLLPTSRSEDALAYLHWYGLERGSPDGFIRLLRDWRERHGAELWAHYGTMLEFVVERPPEDLDSALTLAREHELAAPCTLILPGTPLRHHALGLVGWGEWFLHERP